jgi:hypothetical protein
VLRQTLFQNLGQHLLGCLGTGAGRAALEVSANAPAHLWPDLSPLVLQKMKSYVAAVHPHLYLA